MSMNLIYKNNLTINDRYLISENKGKGGFGEVFLAIEKTTKNKCAIKILKEKTSSFQEEVSILEKVSKLNSQYIINLLEFGEGPIKIDYLGKEYENKQYIVLDYASKGELFKYISYSQNGLNEKYAKLIFGKIIRGVQAFHNAGICHRDLKLQNILLDDSFNPKICDFGFAKEIEGKDGSRKLNDYLGTKNYAAPEILSKIPYNGIKADIFSLGVILFNIISCKNGFITATYSDPYYRYIKERQFNTYWKKVKIEPSENLKDLYIKMVSYNPNERPTIDEILKHPWMKEIEDLNEEEYKMMEIEVLEEFEKLEKKIFHKT